MIKLHGGGGMKWSKLKKAFESFFCDEARGRVELHATRYRWGGRRSVDVGKVWITIDGKNVLDMGQAGTMPTRNSDGSANYRAMLAGGEEVADAFCAGHDKADADGQARGEYTDDEAKRMMGTYVNMPASEVLASGQPFVRAFAMIDRRVGKRRLEKVDVDAEHPLVRALHNVRFGAGRKKNRTGEPALVGSELGPARD